MNLNSDQNTHYKLLVVDDDVFLSGVLRDHAEQAGFQVRCIEDGRHVARELSLFQPDVIFLDLVMPGVDGVEVVNTLCNVDFKAKLVLMSGLDQRTLKSVSSSATKFGLDLHATLSKPFTAAPSSRSCLI